MSIAAGPGMTITAVQDDGTVPQNPGPGVSQFDTAQITVSNLEIPFRIVDDDFVPPGALAPPDNSLMAAAFEAAYIRPVYDLPNNQNVPFILNVALANGAAYDYNFTSQPQNPDPAFWAIYNLSAYQGPTTIDRDPNFEPGVLGITNVIGGYGMQIFKETIRHLLADPDQVQSPVVNEAATVAHEVGHIMNGVHNDGGLMAQSICRNSLQFKPITIYWMRKIQHINQQLRPPVADMPCAP